MGHLAGRPLYTFHLRHDARWSNGEPVTAGDFVHSWQRTLAAGDGLGIRLPALLRARRAGDFNEGKLKDFTQVGVRAIDPATLEVTLENPTPFFLDLCAFSTLLPVHRATVERYGGLSWIKPGIFVGNGAYQLKEWRIFDRVRLVKNERYWNARERRDADRSMCCRPRAPNTAFNFYATGLADLMMDKGLAPTPLMDELKKRARFSRRAVPRELLHPLQRARASPSTIRACGCLSRSSSTRSCSSKKSRAPASIPAYSFVPPGTGAGYQPPPGLDARSRRARASFSPRPAIPAAQAFPSSIYLYKGDSDLDRDIAVELQGMFARELGVNMQLQAAGVESLSRLA